MAYQTGQAASSAALLSVIKTFAGANGWTVSGNMISSANSWTELSTAARSYDSGSYDSVELMGYDNAAKTTPSSSALGWGSTGTFTCLIKPAQYPVTYHLFSHQSPAEFFCVVDIGNGQFSWLAFGELDKGAATYSGGSYACATSFHSTDTRWPGYFYISGGQWLQGNYYPSGFFLSGAHPNYSGFASGAVCARIDGPKWVTTFYGLGSHYLHSRAINTWNNQATLLPIRVLMPVDQGYHMDLGCTPHARYLRITNYNAGDIITLGSERWKVFPFLKKDVVNPNAASGWASGTHGWAIRYDGP
jgi:hypothetical protein